MCIACRNKRQKAHRATQCRNEDPVAERARLARYYAADPEKFRARARRNYAALDDSNIRWALRYGFESNAAFREALRTEEAQALIQLKRAQLKLKRLIRWLSKNAR